MEHTGDIVVIIIVVGALVIGLISMAVGQIARLWDWLVDWRPRPNMSSQAPIPLAHQSEREHRSDAAEQPMERPAGTSFHSVIAFLEQLDDDGRLDILAQLRDEDGEWLYAESRVAKFIGGRTEDRISQVREVRGIPDPPKPGEYRTPVANRPTKAQFEAN